MRGVLVGLCGFSAAILWLALLVVTNFSIFVVSGGLLAALAVIDGGGNGVAHHSGGSAHR